MKFCFVILICLISCSVFAIESEENSMHNILIDSDNCLTYKTNSFEKISKYIKNNQPDSISSMIRFIEKECADTTLFHSLKVLLSIYDNSWQEKYGEEYFTKEIITYIELPVTKYWTYGCFEPISRYDNRYTLEKKIAKLIEPDVDSTSIVFLYVLIKSRETNEFFFGMIQSEKYKNSEIYKVYKERVLRIRESLDKYRNQYAINTGVWHPLNNLNIVGNKLELGFLLGIYNKPFHYNIILTLRGLNIKNNYFVKNDGVVYQADDYFGGHLGVEMGYEYLNAGSFKQILAFGIGGEGFGAVKENENHKEISLNTWNFNTSIYNRFYLNKLQTKYVGFILRYNVVNYKSGGTDLSGNTISIHFTIGGNELPRRYARNYDALYYED